MTYAALTNWKYDKKLYHNIQSGPQRTADDLNLTDTYELVSSGYQWSEGEQQSYYAVNYEGADFGIITAGPPNAEIPNLIDPLPVVYEVQVFNPGLGNKFYLDLVQNPQLRFQKRGTYVFDQSDPTNTGNTLAFSTTPDGTFGGGVIYTDGVTQTGTPGSPGASTTIVVSTEAPDTLYYFSENNNNYGNEIDVQPGPVTAKWGYTTDWRQVPAMISGWWSNYDDYFQRASGVLTVYNGYRRQGLISTANSTVQTAFGPEPGLRDRGAYTYFGAAVPDNQFYSPFETPAGNTAAQGITGGPNTYERVKFPMLTNPTNDSSGSRAAWEYHKPVYCQTFVESVRSTAPGATGGVVRNMYRGKSSRYVPNYAGGYGVLGEGVRNLVRTFSASVNSSNQKGV